VTKAGKLLVAVTVACVMGGWLILGAAPADGSTFLALSESSSDSTPAEYLKALLAFDVSGNTLTLTASNQTEVPHAYYVNRIFFNAADNVERLTLVAPSGWTLNFDEDENKAAPFGKFDVALLGGVGNSPYEIAPGESLTFLLSIQGQGPFADTDFTTEMSHTWGGQIESLAAAKFIRGPCDDSARGNVPDPATICLLGTGLIGLALAGRQRARGA